VNLTIAYVTARRDPCLYWFVESLQMQMRPYDDVWIVVIDFLYGQRGSLSEDEGSWLIGPKGSCSIEHYPCKPTVWQGPHRLTPDHWWAKSAYLNTAACLCETEWLATVDDRCVVEPGYLDAIRRAMDGGYAVAGKYEKRFGMTVVDGVIAEPGTVVGTDPRYSGQTEPVPATGGWFFGANVALPVEWAFEVNGWDESCDSLGLEDCIFGTMLESQGRPIRYDPSMAIIEDRTPSACDPPLARRTDKGVSPDDKSHGLLRRTSGKKQATHDIDLRALRELVRKGEPFPIPTTPTHDWWDGQPLSEFGIK
jgi:hypothetical protein